MACYLYQHPKTKKIVEVIQRMTEPHVYSEDGIEFNRIFTIPNPSFDTKINPFSSKEFSSKMGRKKGKLDDMYREAEELSQIRKDKAGKDPIQEKYYSDWSKKRRGKKHPNLTNKSAPLEISFE